MKVTIAIDSLKGSLSSIEAGNAIKEGILRSKPEASVVVKPLADGGEGTVDAIIEGLGATKVELEVTGPLGAPLTAYYGFLEESQTAILEMASAAGITLLKKEELNPFQTTTYGVGEIILDGLKRGAKKFIIGIGGSATNDGGTGMLRALGFQFLDSDNTPISDGAKDLGRIEKILPPSDTSFLHNVEFKIACDVNNPLCGKNGATYVFGPQKGLEEADLYSVDQDMNHYAQIAAKTIGQDYARDAGSGAAGGLGFAFRSFLNGNLTPGIDLILNLVDLEKEIIDSDIVVTGEGRLDFQTSMGKAPIGVAKLGKQHGATVLAFAGSVTADAKECNKKGIDAFFPILRGVSTLEEAMDSENARNNMADTVEQVFRLL